MGEETTVTWDDLCCHLYTFWLVCLQTLAGKAFDAYYVNLQMPPWIIPFQVLRGAVWAVLAVPVTKMMRGAFWEKGLAVALLFAILMGSLLLIPNGMMPDEIRLSHFVEVITSNFLFGWIVVWVLHREIMK